MKHPALPIATAHLFLVSYCAATGIMNALGNNILSFALFLFVVVPVGISYVYALDKTGVVKFGK